MELDNGKEYNKRERKGATYICSLESEPDDERVLSRKNKKGEEMNEQPSAARNC